MGGGIRKGKPCGATIYHTYITTQTLEMKTIQNTENYTESEIKS